jgi:hypothetical protein
MHAEKCQVLNTWLNLVVVMPVFLSQVSLNVVVTNAQRDQLQRGDGCESRAEAQYQLYNFEYDTKIVYKKHL